MSTVSNPTLKGSEILLETLITKGFYDPFRVERIADMPESGGGAALAPGYYLPAFQAEESVSLAVCVVGQPREMCRTTRASPWVLGTRTALSPERAA